VFFAAGASRWCGKAGTFAGKTSWLETVCLVVGLCFGLWSSELSVGDEVVHVVVAGSCVLDFGVGVVRFWCGRCSDSSVGFMA
jgi:hypothetical protein